MVCYNVPSSDRLLSLSQSFQLSPFTNVVVYNALQRSPGERGGSVVECRTPEREVGGSKPTAAVLCP